MIKNIIFDIGNTLVNVHFDRFKEDLIKEGVTEQDFDKLFLSKKLKDQFESGSISNKEFWQIIKSNLNLKISQKRFIYLFSDMFSEIPEMKRFVEKLDKEKKYRLIILSNTNAYHYKNLKDKFDYFKLFSKFALSYKLKMLKPSHEIFVNVIKRYKLIANQTLFIDDLKENCEAAKGAGFKTVCFKNYKSFKKEFDRIVNYERNK